MLFERACRLKLRFQSTKGLITTEDLFDLSLADLDLIAISLDKQLKESAGKSFVQKKTKADSKLKTMLDVVVSVIATKMREVEKAKQAALAKAEKAKLIDILGRKEDAELEDLPKSEIKKRLKKL